MSSIWSFGPDSECNFGLLGVDNNSLTQHSLHEATHLPRVGSQSGLHNMFGQTRVVFLFFGQSKAAPPEDRTEDSLGFFSLKAESRNKHSAPQPPTLTIKIRRLAATGKVKLKAKRKQPRSDCGLGCVYVRKGPHMRPTTCQCYSRRV